MMQPRFVVWFGLVACLAVPCTAAAAECLDQAAAYAERICGDLKTLGVSRVTDASRNLTAEAKGVFSRILGGGNVSVNLSSVQKSFDNVPHEQLAQELVDNRKCRIRMEEVARNEVCPKNLTFKTCRHPDFGLVGWSNVEEIQDSTSWRSGWTQAAWCAELVRRSVSARGIGEHPYKVDILSSHENAKWGNSVLKTNRQYRYHCTIKLSSAPIYQERRDERCGVLR